MENMTSQHELAHATGRAFEAPKPLSQVIPNKYASWKIKAPQPIVNALFRLVRFKNVEFMLPGTKTPGVLPCLDPFSRFFFRFML